MDRLTKDQVYRLFWRLIDARDSGARGEYRRRLEAIRLRLVAAILNF